MRKKRKIGIAILTILFLLSINLVPAYGETYTATSNPAEQAGVSDGFRYELKCKATNLYLNSTGAAPNPANYTDVNAEVQDSSEEQEWRMEYDSSNDAYRLYLYTSSTKVLDVKTPLQSGANVEIYSQLAAADDCQLWVLDYVPDGQHYIIRLKSNPNLVLTCNSSGSVYVSTETSGSEYEYWLLVLQTGSMTNTLSSDEYYIQNYDTGEFLTVYGSGTANDTNVNCSPYTGGNNQKWDVTYLGNGRYVLRPNYSTTLALHVSGTHGDDPPYPAADESGQNITVYTTGTGSDPDNIANDCEWYIVRDQSDAGTFRLSVQASYLSRGMKVCSDHPDYDVDQHMNGGAEYSKWVFVKTDSSWLNYAKLGWSYMFVSSSYYDYISSGYKLPTRPTHYGIDIVGHGTSINGRAIHAPSSGVVMISEYRSSEGNFIVIRTSSSYDPTSGYLLRYSCKHMNATSSYDVGDSVSEGAIVGYVGTTGDSTGPHLHFAVISDGTSSEYNNPSGAENPQKLFPGVSFSGDTSTYN